ncbi:MAG: DUF1501 domain-containing protein [Pseudomonadota bacterium]
MYNMTRRAFATRLLQTGIALSAPTLAKSAFAQTSFNGKLLMTIQMRGAWDVTQCCDPKMNVAGEPVINNWAKTKSTGTAGRLRYAPVGINQKFFDKHYSKMLVINGVDMQTNAHSTGEICTWSGRTALGFPGLTSLYAASVAPNLALASINLGGWNNSEGLITPTRINQAKQLNNVIYSNANDYNATQGFIPANDLARVQALQMQSVENMMTEQTAMPQDLINRQNFINAVKNSDGLKAFGALIPSEAQLQAERILTMRQLRCTIHQQAQIALLAFKSGLSVAADLIQDGFDTHFDNDTDQDILLGNAFDAVDAMWDYAEQLGLANRLVVVIGGDFGRTPYYNSGAGKDHWPIGSYIIMEKNATYTNRMLGETDGGHNAKKLNLSTVLRDDSSAGVPLYTKHVHKALRKYLGIENSAPSQLFPWTGVEDFRFFG